MKMEEECLTTATDDGQSTELQDQNRIPKISKRKYHNQYWGSVCHNMIPLNG